MDYGVYKNSRDASWKCLIDCGITGLPIKPVAIAKHYGIICKDSNAIELGGASGEIRNPDGEIYILTDVSQSVARRRFTIMHELGHYLLGHLGDTPLSRSRNSVRPEEEYAAERFAVGVLMPACVLWGLGIHNAEDIAQLCGVSMQAAKIRAERMEILYQRNKFLLHHLERQVFQQFQRFIVNYKRSH